MPGRTLSMDWAQPATLAFLNMKSDRTARVLTYRMERNLVLFRGTACMHGTAQHSTLMAFLYQEASSERKEEKKQIHTARSGAEGRRNYLRVQDTRRRYHAADVRPTSHPGADLLPCLPSTVPLQQLNLSTSCCVTLNLVHASLHRGYIMSG